MSEILSADKIELLWKRDHKRKLSDDIFRFVGECLQMQSIELSISQDSDMFEAGYEAGRKSAIEELKEHSRDVTAKFHHEFAPGMVFDGTLAWAGIPQEFWQQLLEEVEKR